MDKYKKIAMIMCSIGLMFLVTGITYAYFNYTKTGENNTLVTGDIYLRLNEGDDEITLTNVFPETKEEARSRNDNIITFTINGINESNKTIYYEIDLVHGNDKSGYIRFNDSDLVFDLIEVGDNNTETYIVDAGSFSNVNNRRIWVDTINGNTTVEVEKTYKLRMWLSEEVIISDSDPNASYPATGTSAYKKHFASVKVKVMGDFNEKIMPGAFYMFKSMASTDTIDFAIPASSTNGEGLYVLSGTENNNHPIYYYRGDINNNNVIFGGFCWQIVRTTDTGGIKMIYNGVATGNGETCENTLHSDRIILNSKFKSLYGTSLAYLGYMSNEIYLSSNSAIGNDVVYGENVEYGDFDSNGTNEYRLTGTTSSSYDATHHYSCKTDSITCTSVSYMYGKLSSTQYASILLENGENIEDAIYKMTGNGTIEVKSRNSSYSLNVNDSMIKYELENWFKTYLTNEVDSSIRNYANYIEDTAYCNDRSFYDKGAWKPNGGPISGSVSFGLYGIYKGIYSTTNVPNLTCPNETDEFRVSNSKAHLNYPVGLITTLEAVLAGASGETVDGSIVPSTNYLVTGDKYWTMTPNGHAQNGTLSIYSVYANGSLNTSDSSGSIGVRPVISLKLGVEFEEDGDGTPTNPYVVKYES